MSRALALGRLSPTSSGGLSCGLAALLCGTDLVCGTREDWQVMTCPVCTLRAECEDLAKANQELRDEVERRAAENARLQDGVSGLIRAIYQTAMRKPAMRKPSP